MRLLGYPPGWYQEAQEYSTSILNVIIDPNERNQNNEINKDLFQEYPGFNVPLGPEFKDVSFYAGLLVPNYWFAYF